MADTAAGVENEADSRSSVTPLPDGNQEADDTDHNDLERVTGSNTNYDSSEGGSSPQYRCNRCDFEAINQNALSAHIVQTHNSNNNNNNNNNNHNSNSNEAIKMEVVENNNSSPPTGMDRVHRKMFECDVCNMKFSNGANMRRHKMRHTGVKPYECRVCQKRFFRKDHLAEHFTTHTKTLPYHCPICNRGFQRQIAMRAHFQNEHVGQHDLVKSCPLCSYRAGSMKSLRVHFFNRHGIDLDNPGPAGSQASLFAAAAQQSFTMDSALTSLGNLTGSVSVSVTSGGGGGNGGGNNYNSDSGDSTAGARSTDNATPPMHFLTPHVEISMAEAPAPVFSPPLNDQSRSNLPGQSNNNNNNNNNNNSADASSAASQRMINGSADHCPGSPQSADSNSNAPSSSHQHILQQQQQQHHHQSNSLRIDQETNITPSISLIPIKQEPGEELYDVGGKRNSGLSIISNNNNNNSSVSPSGSIQMQTATSSSLSSLIKVSPLKSLLRDDLKRKIVSRMNSSPRGRQTASPNNHNSESSPNDTAATTTNGTITSTGPEQPSDSTLWRAINKRHLSGLQCVFCGIGFPDQTLYFLHKGCHSDANPWKCNICGEQCCNVYEFNSHLLSKSHQ